MLEKAFIWFTAFFAVLSVIGILLGYAGLLSFGTSIAGIVLGLVVATVLAGKFSSQPVKEWKRFALLFIILGALLVWVSLPSGIFPVTCSDLMNHAAAVRVNAKTGHFDPNVTGISSFIPGVYVHAYPQIYLGTASMLYHALPNTYTMNTLLMLAFTLLSVLGLFLVARRLFDERIAFGAAFIGGFSITLWHALEAGFGPQLMGQFFAVAALFLFVSSPSSKGLRVLSFAGMLAYPPIYMAYGVFVFAYHFLARVPRMQTLEHFALMLAGGILVFQEFAGLLLKWFFTPEGIVHLLIVRGGIKVPPAPLLMFLAFILIGLALRKSKHKALPVPLAFGVSLGMVMVASAAYFGFNMLIGIPGIAEKQVHQLYLAVKFVYLAFLFPFSVFLSLLCAQIAGRYGNRAKHVLVILGVAYLAYFAGYAFVLAGNQSYPHGFYAVAEKLDTLEPPFSVGVDPVLLQTTYVKDPLLYRSLDDLSKPEVIPSACRQFQVGRTLKFYWAQHAFDKNAFPIVVNAQGHQVVFEGMQGADYYITESPGLSYPVVFKDGGVFVYDLRESA
ncbi:MAG: hypothetical protein HY393_01605 [Candidatus Diapherotrites archaeon]|nr:hypothetical protein [Candidatus Diapherotrites archaeon]